MKCRYISQCRNKEKGVRKVSTRRPAEISAVVQGSRIMGKNNGLCSDSHDPNGAGKELTCQRSAKRGKRATQGKSGNRQDRDLSFENGKLKIFIRKTS